jgi:hypothetical protein
MFVKFEAVEAALTNPGITLDGACVCALGATAVLAGFTAMFDGANLEAGGKLPELDTDTLLSAN